MTRAAAEVDAVLALAAAGHNQCEIARKTGIPRGTIRSWVHGEVPTQPNGFDDHGRPCRGCERGLELLAPAFPSYAYLLGMYLGDGSISSHARGVFRLRIYLDHSYPGIVSECAEAVAEVMPGNRVAIGRLTKQGVDEVSSYSKHWPCLFPQHGAGMKHIRPIRLEEWQFELVERHPWRFLRGLIQSDGCRFINPVRHPEKTYRYTRYTFCNRSDDIRALFCLACDMVGVEWRQMNRWNISVARRDSVALMDRYIGPKR